MMGTPRPVARKASWTWLLRIELDDRETLMRHGLLIMLGAAVALGLPASVFAVDSTVSAATTSVTVGASITLSGVPAALAFGSGVPGDVKTLSFFTATVTTNNLTGYSVKVTTTAMTGAAPSNTNTIAASALNYAVSNASAVTMVAVGGPGDGTVGTVLVTKPLASVAGGDTFRVTPSLTIPFVNSDTYSGTATFVASTL